MQIQRSVKVNAWRLYADLIAALPTLAAVPTAGLGLVPQILIESDALSVTLTVPEGTNTAAIDAVLAKHDPTPFPVAKTAKAIASDAINGATTLPQIKAALLAYFNSGG